MLEICDFRHKTSRQSHLSLTWPKGPGFQISSKENLYRQGYLSTVKERVVRVRVADGKGFLTVKGMTEGFSIFEFEYGIPERYQA